MEPDKRSAFGPLLRHLRLSKGLSQEALAERSRLSPEAIGALERGDRTSPQRQTLALLIDALELAAHDRAQLEAAAVRPSRPRRAALTAPYEATQYRNNLPLQLTTFIGRENVLAEIETLLKQHRLVSLVGAGGVGKTRCALETGMEMLDVWSDGVWLVELSSISDISIVPDTVARALGVQLSPEHPLLEALVTHLRRKQLLLILDNCEHVIEEARNVAALILHTCPGVRILTTSRERLNISGERLYRVPSLSSPRAEQVSPQDVLLFSAPRLFADRALCVDSRFALTRENAPYIAEICRRLDGMPLAIELAAARVKVLSPRQIAQKLDERFRLLAGGDRTALPRHRTMRALFDWSYDLLSHKERSLLRTISIFAGGFTLDAATAVCNSAAIDDIAVLDLLSSLVDKSLLLADYNDRDTRYRLLESVRQYGRERLEEEGEYATVAHAHAAAFLEVAEWLDRSFDTTFDRSWEAHAAPEMENWRAALQWTLAERGDIGLGQRLAAALPRMWYCFALAEGSKWLRHAIDLIDDATPNDVIARLEFAQAQLDGVLAHQNGSYEWAKRALSRFQQLGDARGTAAAQQIGGRAALSLGRLAEGEALLQSSLASAKRLGLRKLTAGTLEYLAIARYFADDLPGARAAFAEALAIAQETGYERVASDIALNLAEVEFRSGDVLAALRLAGEALDRWRSFNDNIRIAYCLWNIATYLATLGRWGEACDNAREALTLARDVQHDVGIAVAVEHLTTIAVLRGSDNCTHARAARLLGYVNMRATALNILREHTEQQQYDKAFAALRNTFGEELANLLREGSSWTEDQAVAEAMLL
jgi:predicted ATPase/DNA-binding XRE family transcriptional regulator